jgi:sulfite exporter TauE/SafE
MNTILPALALGFLGSFHCIGMCGPIALALPINQSNILIRVSGILLYNAGRVITYAILGLLFGLIGQSIAFAGYQQALSITIGALILLYLLFPTRLSGKIPFTRGLSRYTGKLREKLGYLFKQRTLSSLFLIGLLNGLLPCGLVYLGIAGSIATGNVLEGSLFMALFGAGTLPAMISVSFAAGFFKAELRTKIRKAVPVFVGVMAVMLIVRGLNLGIPYLSPRMQSTAEGCIKTTCCHKAD